MIPAGVGEFASYILGEYLPSLASRWGLSSYDLRCVGTYDLIVLYLPRGFPSFVRLRFWRRALGALPFTALGD